MKKTAIIMGMPITIEITDRDKGHCFDRIFDYFRSVDKRFSTYKAGSEISKVNEGLDRNKWSEDMTEVMQLCEKTKKQTNGYFDILHEGKLDPSGLVKGWSINNAAKQLLDLGVPNFYIEAGGDIESNGLSSDGKPWTFGIRNPFESSEIIKVVKPGGKGLATSGTYVRGQHIYNPFKAENIDEVVSLSVIGPDVYEADRFATAAFAMGLKGINFIESLKGFEGYMVDANRLATLTTGFERYVV